MSRADGAPAGGHGALEPVDVPAPEPAEPKPLAPFVLLARDVIARVQGGPGAGAGVLPTFLDGARTQEIVDAVRRGAGDGAWRTVERRAEAVAV
jgi:hypothetical protein